VDKKDRFILFTIIIILIICIKLLNTDIRNLNYRIDNLQTRIDYLKLPSAIEVEITGYYPWAGGINSDGNPDTTATLNTPIPGKTIAISRDLVRKGWLHHWIYIEGIGIRFADDIMGKTIEGPAIDILAQSLNHANEIGRYMGYATKLSN
jgi:3D (Asp-Asp-Asp) domain-containing protein